MTDDDDFVEHDVPKRILSRLIIGALGVFMVVNAGQTIVASFSWMSPNSLIDNVFLAFQFALGTVLIIGVLVVPAQRWTVRRGSVRIESRNLFRRWQQEFGPEDVKEFDVLKVDDGEGGTTWAVVLRTRAGKSMESGNLSYEPDAIKLFLDMRQAFYGDTLPKFYGPPA